MEREREGGQKERQKAETGQRECIYSTPNIFCQVKRMLYNSIYIYIYICILEPLGFAAQGGNAVFAWVLHVFVAVHCGKLNGSYQGLRGRRKRFDGIKRLNRERGRLCLSVIIFFRWISLSRGGLQRDSALLDVENEEKKKVKRQTWFGLNVEKTGLRSGISARHVGM